MHTNRTTINKPLPTQYRIPLLVLAFICLVFEIYSGLIRLNYISSWQIIEIATSHAALMVIGFLETIITLERAIASEIDGAIWPFMLSFRGNFIHYCQR